jgi:hypothetical protein
MIVAAVFVKMSSLTVPREKTKYFWRGGNTWPLIGGLGAVCVEVGRTQLYTMLLDFVLIDDRP